MENYAEHIVSSKGGTKTLVIKIILIVAILFCAWLGTQSMLLMPLLALAILGLLFLWTRLKVEYEYLFINGDLDIDKILGKSKRKKYISMNFEKLEFISPANSPRLYSYGKNNGYKVINCSSGEKESKNPKIAVVGNSSKGKQVQIIIEPSQKMYTLMKSSAKQKFYED